MSLVGKLNLQIIAHTVQRKGYAWFSADHLPYNLNIVSVRADSRTPNRFDDALTVSYQYRGVWRFFEYPITTDPGMYWLRRLLNPKGCAILVPGQYRGVYTIDYHRGAYKALCQRAGAVKVYRDKNRNEVLDLDPKTVDVGWFGINIHRAGASGVTEFVNRHSAGCQVFQSADDFDAFMSLALRSRRYYGNRFTYTLLDESDIKLTSVQWGIPMRTMPAELQSVYLG